MDKTKAKMNERNTIEGEENLEIGCRILGVRDIEGEGAGEGAGRGVEEDVEGAGGEAEAAGQKRPAAQKKKRSQWGRLGRPAQ